MRCAICISRSLARKISDLLTLAPTSSPRGQGTVLKRKPLPKNLARPNLPTLGALGLWLAQEVRSECAHSRSDLLLRRKRTGELGSFPTTHDDEVGSIQIGIPPRPPPAKLDADYY